jgi:hypothetical protein
LGSWELAHPYRFIAHNGEINTIRGNVNWMRARESRLRSELFGEDLGKLSPSSCRPERLGRLSTTPWSFCTWRALPAARGRHDDPGGLGERRPDGPGPPRLLPVPLALMEPWDGPAAVAFTDGRLVGATLDRNGLRPPATPSRRTGGS